MLEMEILVILALGKFKVTQEDECAWGRELMLGIKGRTVLWDPHVATHASKSLGGI